MFYGVFSHLVFNCPLPFTTRHGRTAEQQSDPLVIRLNSSAKDMVSVWHANSPALQVTRLLPGGLLSRSLCICELAWMSLLEDGGVRDVLETSST